jgi:hypothetical protein
LMDGQQTLGSQKLNMSAGFGGKKKVICPCPPFGIKQKILFRRRYNRKTKELRINASVLSSVPSKPGLFDIKLMPDVTPVK